MMKKRDLLYGIVFFVICLIPSLGMLMPGIAKGEAENANDPDLPRLVTDEGVNLDVMKDAGTYFEKHFGFRDLLVTANAEINSTLFGVSTESGVIDGTDGWLYYKSSLDDFQGTNQMSERSVFSVAHTLAMTQKLLEARGVSMIFTVAPNKNTIYPEHMPAYLCEKASDTNNLSRLEVYLNGEGVRYVDLKEVLTSRLADAKEELGALYHKRDSHWNNQGAAIAAGAILDELDKVHTLYDFESYEVRSDFEGDLDRMLFPKATTREPELYYDTPETFTYVEPIESTFDPQFQSVNQTKSGSLVMYRDSFGNALTPFMSQEFGAAYFSRGVPYQLTDVSTHAADTVVIERAQRFLPDMAKNPPVIEAGLALIPAAVTYADEPGVTEFTVVPQGLGQKLTGFVDPEYLHVTSKIYVRVGGEFCYEAFPMTVEENSEDGTVIKDNGFVIYLSQVQMKNGDLVEVLVHTDGEDAISIYQENYIAPEGMVAIAG